MNTFFYKTVILSFFLLMCSLHGSAIGEETRSYYHSYDSNQPRAEEMVFDALIIRPISLVTTVAGSAIYAISLPFSLPGGNEREARERLIYDPARYTFKRPLGAFPSEHRY